MAQNLHCPCLCHGNALEPEAHGDRYFCCKCCYAGFHMDALPREHRQKRPKKGASKKAKVSAGQPAEAVVQ